MRQLRRLVAVAALVAIVPAGAQKSVTTSTGTYELIEFDLLSNFSYEMPDPLDPGARPPVNLLPKPVISLTGRRVAIVGFMLPIDLTPKGVSQFMLNASLDMCYFGAPVRFNDWIMVTMKNGKRAKFTHLPTKVFGTLDVGEVKKNGRIVSLYRMVADDAEAGT